MIYCFFLNKMFELLTLPLNLVNEVNCKIPTSNGIIIDRNQTHTLQLSIMTSYLKSQCFVVFFLLFLKKCLVCVSL